MRFNGVDLRQAHRALSVAKEFPPGMPGRNLVTTGTTLGEALAAVETIQDEYTVRVNIAGKTREEAWEARAALAAWAMSSGDELGELEPTRMPGKAYSAIVKTISSPEFVFGFGTVDVVFMLPEPIMHDRRESIATANRTTKVEFVVGGTERVQPTIRFVCAGSGSGILFRVDDTDMLRMRGTVNEGDVFDIDLKTGRVTVADIPAGDRIVYTDTDLDVLLKPGRHSITSSRTGELTVRWRNKWV